MADPNLAQYISFVVAIILASLPSVVGSSALAVIVSRDLTKVYHRTLLSISLVDIVLSASNIVHLFLVAEDKTASPYAFGNDATCSAMGFFLYFSMTFLAIHSSVLSVNFLMQIRYKWNERQISRYIEIPAYILTSLLAIGIPGAAAVTGGISPSEEVGLCMLLAYPVNCVKQEDVPCERGEFTQTYLSTPISATVYLFCLMGFACTYGLYRTVQQTMVTSARHAFVPGNPSFHAAHKHRTSSNSDSPEQPQRTKRPVASRKKRHTSAMDDKQRERLQRVSRQCVLYALAYFNTALWPLVCQVTIETVDVEGNMGNPGLYSLRLASHLFFPLQGFLNFVVFIYPKYNCWRQALPEETWTYVLRKAMTSDSPPTRQMYSKYSLTLRSKRPSSHIQQFSEQQHLPVISETGTLSIATARIQKTASEQATLKAKSSSVAAMTTATGAVVCMDLDKTNTNLSNSTINGSLEDGELCGIVSPRTPGQSHAHRNQIVPIDATISSVSPMDDTDDSMHESAKEVNTTETENCEDSSR